MKPAKILVVEDEEQVRSLIVRLLQKRGYEVAQAHNGSEAIDLLTGAVGEYALVISDLVMPVMGGAALLREIRMLRADLPFLCMTGYSRDEVAAAGNLEGAQLIEKPFTPSSLMAKIDEILSK